MSFFQNSNPQKRGVLAETSSTRISAARSLPKDVQFRNYVGRTDHKRLRIAQIGGPDTKGLVIFGSTATDNTQAENPDGANPATSGESFINPDFPISFSGRGTMAFKSPIRVPSILGDVNVQGKVYAEGQELGGGGGGASFIAFTTFSPQIRLGGTPLSTQGVTTSQHKQGDDIVWFDMTFSWTGGLGGGTGAVDFTFDTAPIPNGSVGGFEVKAESGVFVTNLGNELQVDLIGGTLQLFEVDVAAGGTRTAITHTNLLASGQIVIWGHYQETP